MMSTLGFTLLCVSMYLFGLWMTHWEEHLWPIGTLIAVVVGAICTAISDNVLDEALPWHFVKLMGVAVAGCLTGCLWRAIKGRRSRVLEG